jgi:tripartite-type tricarboxylate transporter receptor subunit TctC
MNRLAMSVLLAAAATAFAPRPLAAQSWPSRPITMVVTFAAGGPADGTARLIANELGEKLGQRVVIENKGGAGGNIGAASVVKAPPDGYTLLMVSSGPGAVNKLIYKSLPYDPLKDFAPVVLVANVPTIILVSRCRLRTSKTWWPTASFTPASSASAIPAMAPAATSRRCSSPTPSGSRPSTCRTAASRRCSPTS